MHPYAIVHTAERQTKPSGDSGMAQGLEVAALLGPAEGSVHMQVAHSVLHAGGSISGHLHAYEESFFVLSGEVWLRMNGVDVALRAGDFGVAPLGVAHAWKNVSDQPARWLRIRVPQPRNVDDESEGTYLCAGFDLPEDASPPPFGLPSARHFGHFTEEQLPPPGPISLRGTNHYGVRNISLRFMVDDTAGARHHVVFVGQMASDPAQRDGVPPPHYHAFEESYYFVSGTARGLLEGEEHSVSAGDIVFAGVNATHGFVPTSTAPLRWIEVMAPRPPEQDSMLFVNQWEEVGEAARRGRW